MNSPVSSKNDGDTLRQFQTFSQIADHIVAAHPIRSLLLSKKGKKDYIRLNAQQIAQFTVQSIYLYTIIDAYMQAITSNQPPCKFLGVCFSHDASASPITHANVAPSMRFLYIHHTDMVLIFYKYRC